MANTNLNWTTKTDDVDDVTAEDFNNLVANIETEFDKKVDKVTGKGLSKNNYTDTDKAEVAKIKDKVGFTDYATGTKVGVVKADSIKGIKVDESGEIGLNVPNETAIAQRLPANSNLPITIGNLDYAVRSVRPNVIQNTNSEITLTCAVNTIYCLGGNENVTSIALTLPATGQYGDFIQVDFYSDASSPTNLTITSNAGFTDFTLIPEGDHIYSLFFDWGMAFGDSAWGWRFNYAEYPYVANS